MPSAAFQRDKTPLDKSITGQTGTTASSGGGGGSGGAAFARMLVGLVIVIAVILAVYWLLKTYSRSSKGGLREDGRIEVLATTTLAPTRAVHLIRVGNELMLVGSSDGGVTPIRVYDAGRGPPARARRARRSADPRGIHSRAARLRARAAPEADGPMIISATRTCR